MANIGPPGGRTAMPRAPSSDKSTDRPETPPPPAPPKRKTSHVWTDFERQLFNIDLSASEFRRLAKSEEERSMVCKRRCSGFLRDRLEEEAWRAAEAAIKAQNDAFLFNTASERLRMFHKMVSHLDEPDASLLWILKRVDQSVRGYDPKGTIEHLNDLDLEIADPEREELVRLAGSDPLEDEVRAFLGRAEASNAMTYQLRGVSPPRSAKRTRITHRRPSRQLDSSQTPIDTRVKKKTKKVPTYRRTAFGMKEVRFTV